MRFLIVGVGALGSAYLSFLTKAGYEAVGLVKRGRALDFIRVEGIWGSFQQRVKTVDSLDSLDAKPDLIILTVKAYDTERALEDIKELKDKALLMVAQNGYGNYEKAVRYFGEGRVILSRVIFGAKLLDWGHIKITVCGDDVVLGDPSGKMEEDFLKDLAKSFSKACIPTRYERDVYKYLWDKILYNCALNPLGALFEKTYGELANNPYTKQIMDSIIEEAFDVIRANQIPIFWKDAEEYKRHFYENLIPPTAQHYPSMLEDIKKGKT
ncbi:MAG: ketopantoate reductase family protein, partial [Aquificaceae bacterium]